MGLPSAIRAHAKRDFKNAKIHYERALSQESYSSVLFQNYGALLREIGELDRAKEIYNQEYGAKFTALSGQVYNEFDRNYNVGDYNYIPNHPTALVHLAGLDNIRQDKNKLSNVETLDGLQIKKSLRYNV
mgnify:CR=1 FL=1